jgi:hypothetical protein
MMSTARKSQSFHHDNGFASGSFRRVAPRSKAAAPCWHMVDGKKKAFALYVQKKTAER